MMLLELQRRMVEDIRRPLTAEYRMQTTSHDGESVQDIANGYIAPNDRLSSFERLEIYNRSYWFRVIDSVSEDFPALRAVLGRARFDALVLQYLNENPSRSWTLRNLGARLPAWLLSHPELTDRHHRLATDVARLEWAYIESFDGLRVQPLSREEITSLQPDAVLALQPHLQLLQLSYPVDQLVLAVHRGKAEKEIASNTATATRQTADMPLPSMRQQTVYLAIHRFEDSVYYRRIDREAFRLLTALRNGMPMVDSLQLAFSNSRLTPHTQLEKIRQYFAHASELGWFCIDSHTS